MKSQMKTIFAVISMMAIFALTPPAESGAKNTFQSECEDPKYTCTTTILQDHVEVGCEYPPADWKTQQVYANMVVVYKCQLEMGAMVCKGFLAVSPNTKATFTREEFKDNQIRCNKICKPCPKGWK